MDEGLREISADSLPQFVIFPNTIASASALLWLRIAEQADTTAIPSAILLALVANRARIGAPVVPVLSGNLQNVGGRRRSQGAVSRQLIGFEILAHLRLSLILVHLSLPLVRIRHLNVQVVLQIDVDRVVAVVVVRVHFVVLSRGFSLLPWDEAIRFWYSRTCFDDGLPALSFAFSDFFRRPDEYSSISWVSVGF